ncbi:ABC transporter permease [Saccharolobus caldissimus]|uniref:Sodium ABC transporter permease n=1 Tax=Saccharolobus caldissimus TaxID=1702097 RepID=A0AAQ4CSU5_9CREN|nr:ABC transporter permease [Saccharolobus caldissimus]BDB98876.1 sodium ABC transporter permease [Saccharolobus caldissimus]
MIRTVLKKELLDIKRDKKLILGSIILPFILLPLIGIILYASVAVSPPVIEIINYNQSNIPYVNLVANYILQNGGIVFYNKTNNTPDAVIIFPNDFSLNVSNISKRAYLIIYILISSNQETFNLVNNALGNLEYNIVQSRVEYMINASHLYNVNYKDIISPLIVKQKTVSITGKGVPESQANLSELARIVGLVLFPSATPVIFYVTEGIVGEKERKTLESLLASPISIRSFIFSKVIISILLGILSSLGDILGIVIFSSIISYTTNSSVSITLTFSLIVVCIYLLAVLLTAALSVILLIGLGGSMRNIQLINFLVLTFGLVASFSALFINVASISFPLNLISIIPYEQLSLSMLYYVSGSTLISYTLLIVTLVISIIILLISSKLFNSERLLLK